MPRKHVIPFFVLFNCLCVGSSAQCILPSVLSVSSSCSGVSVMLDFTLDNATPPYEYAILVDGVTHLYGDTDPSGFTYLIPWNGNTTVSSIQITVHDAADCNTGGAWTGQLVRTDTPLAYSVTRNCDTGLGVLRWTNANLACGSGGAHIAWVDGTVGTVASLFTQESANVWRYNAGLSFGPHVFGMDVTNTQYPGYPCGAGLQCWGANGLASFSVTAVQPGECVVSFNLRAALAGPLLPGGSMSEGLRSGALLPLTEPYSGLGYTYVGSPSLAPVPASYVTDPAYAMVDWVVIELHSATNPATVVRSRPCFIDASGRVVERDFLVPGTSTVSEDLTFPVPAGNYYVALRHRNHLGIMTAAPVALDAIPELLDMRLSSTPAYGTNARADINGVMALWPGDANGNGTVQYTGAGNDRDMVLQAIGGSVATNTVTNVYSALDINMNGTVQYTGANNDRDLILQTIGGSVATATRTQQLP